MTQEEIIAAQLAHNRKTRPHCVKCGGIESLAHGFGGSEKECARCGGEMKMLKPAKGETDK